MLIIGIAVILIYLVCPIVGKLALLLVNTVLPDPIPFVDEIIMWLGLMIHLSHLYELAEFISEHKKQIILWVSVIAIVVLMLILFF